MRRTTWPTLQLVCERCGCTDLNACVVVDRKDGSFRGCSWDETAPGVICSGCSGTDKRIQGAHR